MSSRWISHRSSRDNAWRNHAVDWTDPETGKVITRCGEVFAAHTISSARVIGGDCAHCRRLLDRDLDEHSDNELLELYHELGPDAARLRHIVAGKLEERDHVVG